MSNINDSEIQSFLAAEEQADAAGLYSVADDFHESACRLAVDKSRLTSRDNVDVWPQQRRDFTEADPDFWETRSDTPLVTPKWPSVKGRHPASGLMMVEPDERIWLHSPPGDEGYKLSKGRLEPDLTWQQNALKEAWEELGLQGRVDDYLGDYANSSSVSRFYVGGREKGVPWQFDPTETKQVALAPIDKAEKMLSRPRDQAVVKDLRKWLKKQGEDDSLQALRTAEETSI